MGNIPGGTTTDHGTVIDYKVLYDKCIDSIVIYYAEWSHL